MFICVAQVCYFTCDLLFRLFCVMISLVIALLVVFRFILIAGVLFSLLSGGGLAVFGDLWLVWFRYLLAVWCCFWLLL